VPRTPSRRSGLGCFDLIATEWIRAIKDLKGKTVAVFGMGSAQHILSSMLAHVGLDPSKDVTWVTLTSAGSGRDLALLGSRRCCWHYAGERSMSDGEVEETRDLWNRVADDWRIQVGDDGDGNRTLNSDPVLWKFAGDVSGLTVLDAGCGTGYLAKKLC
jgi:NMT1/THI5 like protein